MPYYAQLNTQNICASVKDAHSIISSADHIEIDSLNPLLIGKRWHLGAWEVFTPAHEIPRIMATAAYLKRFDLPERAAINLMSIDDPNATEEIRLRKATIREVLKDLDRSTEIPLDDPEFQVATMATCELLVEAGLIENALGKFNDLVNTPVQLDDLPERLKALYQQ